MAWRAAAGSIGLPALLAGCSFGSLDDLSAGTASNAGGSGATATTSTSISSGGAGAGGEASATGGGGRAPRATIHGSDVPVYIIPGNETSKPVDLSSGHSISALSPNDSGGSMVVGTGLSNGTFSIPDVPVGHYSLNIDTSYYWLDNDGTQPELGPYVPGRTTQAAATTSTLVTFDIADMDAWDPLDDMQFMSFQSNTYGTNIIATFDTLPASGATTFSATTDWWSGTYPPNLLTPTDALWCVQLKHQQSAAGTDYEAAVRASMISGVAMQNAQPITISGIFDVALDPRTTKLNLSVAEYEAAAPAVNPNATPTGRFYAVDVLPTTPEHGVYGNTFDLLRLVPLPATDVVDAKLDYGNPLPPGFTEICQVAFDYTVDYQLAGASALHARAKLVHFDTLPECESGVLGVKLSPPTNVQIDGKPGADAQTLGSATPVLEWDPPTIGTPRQYVVSVSRLYVAANKTKREVVGELFTDATTMTLPPGILKSSEQYYLAVEARSASGPPYAVAPNRYGLPYAGATMLTGILAAP